MRVDRIGRDYVHVHGNIASSRVWVHGNITSSRVWVHGMVIHHSW